MNLPVRIWACNLLLWVLLSACSGGETASATTSEPEATALAAQIQEFESLEQMQNEVPFPVLVPDSSTLPTCMELVSITLQDSSGPPVVVLIYAGNDQTLSLTQFMLPAPLVAPSLEHEEVPVRGEIGYLIAPPEVQNKVLIWSEEGRVISLDGELPFEELLTIAESLMPFEAE